MSLQKPKRTSTVPTFPEMDAKLEAARLVESSLARLIKRTSAAGKKRALDGDDDGMDVDWEGGVDGGRRKMEELDEDDDEDLLGVVNYRKRVAGM